MNFNDITKTISKIAPTIGAIITNPIGGGISLLCDLIGSATATDVEGKIQQMPINQIVALEKKLQLELEIRKIELEENKIKHTETMTVFEDRRQSRELFANNKEIVRFGMGMAIFGMITIVYFTYKSLHIDDQHLHFVREVKAFIEGSVLMLIMQYFFGSAHKD